MLQPKLISIRPSDNYELYLEYENSEKKIFDVKPYLVMPFYKPLKDITLFKGVHIVDDGWTVEWANGRDISPSELYDNSIPIS